MLIDCPWCGPGDENEYAYGGQAHVAYPTDPAALDDAEWAAFVFLRDNPEGWWRERWHHGAGCRRWFHAVRHTTTNRIAATYRVGDPVPPLPGDQT
jgi:heterotetrameric sarcosine oxidase delta subunit